MFFIAVMDCVLVISHLVRVMHWIGRVWMIVLSVEVLLPVSLRDSYVCCLLVTCGWSMFTPLTLWFSILLFFLTFRVSTRISSGFIRWGTQPDGWLWVDRLGRLCVLDTFILLFTQRIWWWCASYNSSPVLFALLNNLIWYCCCRRHIFSFFITIWEW
jgi:hypothetical protein